MGRLGLPWSRHEAKGVLVSCNIDLISQVRGKEEGEEQLLSPYNRGYYSRIDVGDVSCVVCGPTYQY